MGCGELKGNAKPVVPAPALINEIQIALIKMKILCQLTFIWLSGIAAIILNLVIGQKSPLISTFLCHPLLHHIFGSIRYYNIWYPSSPEMIQVS